MNNLNRIVVIPNTIGLTVIDKENSQTLKYEVIVTSEYKTSFNGRPLLKSSPDYHQIMTRW